MSLLEPPFIVNFLKTSNAISCTFARSNAQKNNLWTNKEDWQFIVELREGVILFSVCASYLCPPPPTDTRMGCFQSRLFKKPITGNNITNAEKVAAAVKSDSSPNWACLPLPILQCILRAAIAPYCGLDGFPIPDWAGRLHIRDALLYSRRQGLSHILVCRNWHDAGIALLYERIEIGLRRADAFEFENALERRPSLGKFIKHIGVTQRFLYFDCDAELPEIKNLPDDPGDAALARQRVRELMPRGECDSLNRDFIQIFGDILKLLTVRLRSIGVWTYSDDYSRALVMAICNQTQVKYLSLRGVPAFAVQLCLGGLPNLQQADIVCSDIEHGARIYNPSMLPYKWMLSGPTTHWTGIQSDLPLTKLRVQDMAMQLFVDIFTSAQIRHLEFDPRDFYWGNLVLAAEIHSTLQKRQTESRDSTISVMIDSTRWILNKVDFQWVANMGTMFCSIIKLELVDVNMYDDCELVNLPHSITSLQLSRPSGLSLLQFCGELWAKDGESFTNLPNLKELSIELTPACAHFDDEECLQDAIQDLAEVMIARHMIDEEESVKDHISLSVDMSGHFMAADNRMFIKACRACRSIPGFLPMVQGFFSGMNESHAQLLLPAFEQQLRQKMHAEI